MDANKQEDIWEMLVDEEKQNRWIGFGGGGIPRQEGAGKLP